MTYAAFPHDLVWLHNDRVSREDAQRQESTAEDVLTRLEQQPGVVLADEVGMGKTFVALAVAVSVVLARPTDGPVVVMVPPSLKTKWPRDWEVFRQMCLASGVRESLRAQATESGVGFLRLLDDPPDRRNHLVFLTHGALNRALSDGWVKLALIKRAFKGRSSLAEQRRNFGKFAGRLLGMESSIERRAGGLLGDLLERPCENWLKAIHRAHRDFRTEITDNPVPRHIDEVLESMDGRELDELVEALSNVPLRESSQVPKRLQDARRALAEAMRGIWTAALRRADFTSPLLVLDEAHHLKNPATRLASLFVDEEAASESDLFESAGPLGGKFERMLFLTATPFQLGHAELLRVLEQFEGVKWNSPRAPKVQRQEFRKELEGLGKTLDDAQASALCLDRAWGRLTREHLLGQDGRERSPEEWWAELDRGDASPVVQQVLEQVERTRTAMQKGEAALGPWVLRHLKPGYLPDWPAVPRRTVLPGAAIREDGSPSEGLSIDADVLLPFLLAGRARALLATSSRGRALFAEGLASSFEAYLETREGTASRDEEEESEPADDGQRAEVEWYLRHLDRALRRTEAARAAHPKIRATAERAVELWSRGEKVLVFCHYRATGRALRRHISALLEDRIVRLAQRQVPDLQPADVLERLEAIGRRFFDSDSPLRRRVTETLHDLVAPFHGLGEGERDRVVDVVRRFVRTPSFLVRYFSLDKAQNPRAFVEALDRLDDSGLSLRRKITDFCRFLAERCVPAEREEFLDALDRIQTGAHVAGKASAAFDAAEGVRGDHDTGLWPNVRLANGGVRDETRRRLLLAFNTPLFPEILVASSVLAEGVDLHLSCRYVIHHDLCWNPSTLEQRSGRVDRIGSKAEKVGQSIHLFLPYVAATQDEKMYRVVRDRERWFQIVMGEKFETDEQATDRRAERVPLPVTLQQELSMKLLPTNQAHAAVSAVPTVDRWPAGARSVGDRSWSAPDILPA